MIPPEEPFQQLLMGHWVEATVKPWNDQEALQRLRISYTGRFTNTTIPLVPDVVINNFIFEMESCDHCDDDIEDHTPTGKCAFGATTYESPVISGLCKVFERNDITFAHLRCWVALRKRLHAKPDFVMFEGDRLPDAKELG